MAGKLIRKLKPFLIFLLVIAGAWAVQRWAYSEEIIFVDGKEVTVIDGDSFKVGESEYRIYGIDAPEYRQVCKDKNGADWACGKTARTGLDQNLRANEFSCDVRARDQFGRTIVLCRDRNGIDLGASLVEQGLAASGHHFDETIYAKHERRAEKAKRGIWQGSFTRPDIWRTKNPKN